MPLEVDAIDATESRLWGVHSSFASVEILVSTWGLCVGLAESIFLLLSAIRVPAICFSSISKGDNFLSKAAVASNSGGPILRTWPPAALPITS
jgi:hypothetical protein